MKKQTKKSYLKKICKNSYNYDKIKVVIFLFTIYGKFIYKQRQQSRKKGEK